MQIYTHTLTHTDRNTSLSPVYVIFSIFFVNDAKSVYVSLGVC